MAIREQLREQVKEISELEEQSYNYINPLKWAYISLLCDFYLSGLNCIYKQRKWSVIQLLVKHCGWFLLYEKTSIVSDRPTKLSFDTENHLHAQGKPAIQFGDGYSLYS